MSILPKDLISPNHKTLVKSRVLKDRPRLKLITKTPVSILQIYNKTMVLY